MTPVSTVFARAGCAGVWAHGGADETESGASETPSGASET